MSNLIDRDEVMKIIVPMYKHMTTDWLMGTNKRNLDTLEKIMERILSLPLQQQWIDAKYRLPNISLEYIICEDI
jgi:hypothetical protein